MLSFLHLLPLAVVASLVLLENQLDCFLRSFADAVSSSGVRGVVERNIEKEVMQDALLLELQVSGLATKIKGLFWVIKTVSTANY